MDEIERAGTKILQSTLWVIVVVMLVLIAAAAGTDAIQGTCPPPAPAIGGPTAETVSALSETILSALQNETVPPDTLAAARRTIHTLQLGTLLSTRQKQLIGPCANAIAGAAPDRTATLQLCANTLDVALERIATREQAARAENLEARKLLNQQRADNHAFWLQFGQLLLATILLPIASTLVGNLFVSRAANAAKPEL